MTEVELSVDSQKGLVLQGTDSSVSKAAVCSRKKHTVVDQGRDHLSFGPFGLLEEFLSESTPSLVVGSLDFRERRVFGAEESTEVNDVLENFWVKHEISSDLCTDNLGTKITQPTYLLDGFGNTGESFKRLGLYSSNICGALLLSVLLYKKANGVSSARVSLAVKPSQNIPQIQHRSLQPSA